MKGRTFRLFSHPEETKKRTGDWGGEKKTGRGGGTKTKRKVEKRKFGLSIGRRHQKGTRGKTWVKRIVRGRPEQYGDRGLCLIGAQEPQQHGKEK